MNEKAIKLTENVLDIRKKNAGQPVEQKEVESVIERFRELVNAPKV